MEFSIDELSKIRCYLGTALDEAESCIADLSADAYADPSQLKDLEYVKRQANEIQAFISRIDRAIA